MPKEAQFQPSTLQLNSELLQECCQTGKRFSTLSHSKHQLPRITAEESQILLLNSDYSTKSKNLKPTGFLGTPTPEFCQASSTKGLLPRGMKWECCNTHRTVPLKGNAPQPCLATLSPSSLPSPVSLMKTHLHNPIQIIIDTLTSVSSQAG